MPAPLHSAPIPELLSCLPLFESLNPDELSLLARDCRILNFKRAETLFRAGDRASGLFVMLCGAVKVIKEDALGNENVLHIIRPGNFLAEAAVFQGDDFPCSAVALESGQTLLVARAALLALIAANPALALRMLAALSLRLRMLTHKLGHSRQQGNAAARLAVWLVHRCKLSGTDRPASGLSREVLAGLLGLARETLSRALSLLIREGLVELDGRDIVIRDPEALEYFAHRGRAPYPGREADPAGGSQTRRAARLKRVL